MAKGQFDSDAFHAALDSQRQSRKLTWKQVAQQSGVSASTLTRMAQGKRPDVDSLATLLTWSGLDANAFVRTDGTKPGEADSLAKMTAYLRADPNLTTESAIALESLLKAAYERLRKG